MYLGSLAALSQAKDKTNKQLSKKYEELEVGYEFPNVSYELDPSIVSKYEEAVEARSPLTNVVPPMAIAAYAMKAASQFVDMPPGSIHTSQEIEFLKPVTVGSHIYCQSRVIQKLSRANLNMLVIELATFDQDKEPVLSGKTTLILAS